ncbi:hypothetical protein [Paenibacillus sp. 481]|uniref:hypothetical protein n=1 Tax=Paenibacillus sp. 481 TaxID=2835869 RepID=UPI001E319609|nr:hypothetical protein [Paenibacillus sp. 481]UHA72741.1 hypothetical protein KIK04_19215 [Paenibacillus sp. 481]
MNTTITQHPVLLIGGSGMVGKNAAEHLRRFHPELPILIGGRNLEKAQTVANQLGNAQAVQIDLERPNLGLPEDIQLSAVGTFFRDGEFYSQRWAQNKRIPFLFISGYEHEIGKHTSIYLHGPLAAPVVIATHWMGGIPITLAKHYARQFRSIEAINISVIFDPEEEIGPDGTLQNEGEIEETSPYPLFFQDGKWKRAKDEMDIGRTIKTVDGSIQEATAFSSPDILSLGAMDIKSARFDFLAHESSGRKSGGQITHDIIIEITGELKDGTLTTVRREIVYPDNQSSMTGLGAAIGIEHLLGLVDTAPRPGLYFPENVIDPLHLEQRLKQTGTHIS